MKTIESGGRGLYVKYLQLALNRAGYPTLIDGIFGEGTCASLREFLGEPEAVCRVDEAVWNRLIPYLKGYIRHEVRTGDTYAGIAARYGVDTEQIMQANPAVDPDNLIPGRLINVPFGFDLVPDNVPISSELNEWIIEGLIVRYPFLSRGQAGQSVMGRPLSYLKIGTGSRELFYNASFHANEWITSLVLLRFAEEYSKAYAKERTLYTVRASWLFYGFTLYLMPLVNPDGVDLVTGALTEGLFYENAVRIAAQYPRLPFPNGWKANIEGIDLNLQFPAGWEQARENKFAQGYTTPAPRDYVGEEPLSAPESRAVYEFTREHDFRLILAYHAQGEVIYWKYLDYEPEDSRRIALYFGKVSGYAVELTPSGSGYAGYKDWFIQDYNRPGYTIEVGRGVSPLPLSQFPGIYFHNRLILEGGMTELE